MNIEEKDITFLMKQGKENEVIAFLYKTVFPKIMSYILKQNGRREDAHDIFQDAILYFYKQVMENTFNEKYTVFGYIYRLSINRWINKIKRDKKIQYYSELPEGYEPEIEQNFAGLDKMMDSKSILDTIFTGVGDKCKEILLYAISYDLMIEDIMVRMNFVSEGAVKMQVKRCKEKLYKAIEENPSLLKKIKEQ